MKKCSECGDRKRLVFFYKKAASPDGHAPQCKDCRKSRDKAKYTANRDRLVAAARQYRQDFSETIRERRKGQYSRMTPGQQATKLAGNHRWLKNHPEKNANYAAKRRARIRNAPVVELVDRQTVYDRENGICYLCTTPISRKKFHLEHVVPLVKGGEHTYRNVRIACPSCNSRKGARCAS